jgi:AraC-like DNA-binding protein
LILRSRAGERQEFFISPLFDETHLVSTKAGTEFVGFRMKPGIKINEQELLASFPRDSIDIDDISSLLCDFSYRKDSVAQALDCMSSDIKGVSDAATELGVSQRTLQRMLIKETGRPPVYWMMLSRARKAARTLLNPLPLVEVADRHRYADQSHMTREIKRWFGVSPTRLRDSPDICRQLNEAGYG